MADKGRGDLVRPNNKSIMLQDTNAQKEEKRKER